MRKGFTLIELLVVIVIIGILATLATVALSSARSKARDARRVSDVKQIQTALELYYNDATGYPTTSGAATAFRAGMPLEYGTTTYMAKVPSNALPADGTACVGLNTYTYSGISVGANGLYSSYTLSYCLGGTTGSLTAGLGTASPGGIQ